MTDVRDKQRKHLNTLNFLVLFLSDIWFFARRWKPVRVTFRSRLSTEMLWRMSRKRRVVKSAVLEKKEQNKIYNAFNKAE